MPELSEYSWDFDRPPEEWMAQYETFSVGVFQWVPKSRGNGLKQSSTMSRVLGYTAEPERVYEKANELCSRLNREGAKASARPAWLQKQYSIPRPPGMVVERWSTEFTAAQVRAMRLRVMKERLLPTGFVVGRDSSYIRRHGDQIHLINFQGSQYGHKFTVNLGFSYCFVPPLLQQRELALKEYGLLDCLFCDRIGALLPGGDGRDRWFEYGEDREALIANLELCATTSLAEFDRVCERWNDPAVLLKDVSERTSPWSIFNWHDSLAPACLELKLGRIADVERRLREWKDDRYTSPSWLHVWLTEMLKSGGSPLSDWIIRDAGR